MFTRVYSLVVPRLVGAWRRDLRSKGLSSNSRKRIGARIELLPYHDVKVTFVEGEPVISKSEVIRLIRAHPGIFAQAEKLIRDGMADEREQQVASLLTPVAVDPLRRTDRRICGRRVRQGSYFEDVDILASSNYRSEWVRWLETNGLLRKRLHTVARQGGRPVEVQVWHHMAVSLESMTGGTPRSRIGVVIPEPWILRDSHSVQSELLSGRLDAPVNVVRLEGLWAMKVIAGRPQDVHPLRNKGSASESKRSP